MNGKHSIETKRKISQALKGENAYWYGKRRPKFSKECLNKMSTSKKGKNHPLYGKTHQNSVKYNMSNIKRGLGLFNFTGVSFNKKANPEKRCWVSRIKYNMRSLYLGSFEDPLSGQIVHDFVLNALWGNQNG